MIAFFDASALVKRYIAEPGTEFVRELLLQSSASASRLSEIEVASAINRRHHAGDYGDAARDRLMADFDSDRDALRVIELVPAVVTRARRLLAVHPPRASGAVQLASALHVQAQLDAPVRFACFDQRLVAAAAREGLIVVGTGA